MYSIDILDPTKVITGIGLLVQNFITELLTDIHSVAYFPNKGCTFVSAVRQTAASEFDVISAFASARFRIAANLRETEKPSTPNTERYGHARLDQIIIHNNTLTLALTIFNKAGQYESIQTPDICLT